VSKVVNTASLSLGDTKEDVEYFGGGPQETQTNQHAGDAISKVLFTASPSLLSIRYKGVLTPCVQGAVAAEESARQATDKYMEDKQKRFE